MESLFCELNNVVRETHEVVILRARHVRETHEVVILRARHVRETHGVVILRAQQCP